MLAIDKFVAVITYNCVKTMQNLTLTKEYFLHIQEMFTSKSL
jgi:hypothetical protein